MAIPSKQIGWSNEANLLWYVAKELEQIKGQLNKLSPTTPTTTTTTTSTSSTTSTTTTAAPTTYTIGEAALGGIIAYIDGGGSTGTSGLVVSAADVSTGTFWGCQDVDISTGSAIGTGYQNTINIVNNCTTPGIAAKLCRDLSDGGFSDWYLPSKDELDALYANSVAIGITSNIYWTSTQYETNSIGAWFKNFSNGSPSIDVKDTNHYVRAVRSF